MRDMTAEAALGLPPLLHLNDPRAGMVEAVAAIARETGPGAKLKLVRAPR